jgi:hypothetical protein
MTIPTRGLLATALATLLCGGAGTSMPASAQQPKLVGTWLISNEKDRFTGDPKIVAVTVQNGGAMLALRCMERSLTFAARDGFVSGLTTGEMFVVSFKGGSHPVAATMGDAVDDSIIEVLVTDDMRPQLLDANEFAFRFKGLTRGFDMVFQAGTAAKSLPPVINACPPKPKDEE